MSELYKVCHDRPLKGGRSFRQKKRAYIISISALLLLAVTVVWLVGGTQKHQVRPLSVAGTEVQGTDKGRPLRAREAVGPPAATTDAEIATPEETPWAAQLRSLRELAANSPDEAIAQVASIEEKHERKSAAASVCTVIAAADPAKAMVAAWALELGRFSDETKEVAALDAVARRWAEVDPVRALTWVSALPMDEESRRDHVVRGIGLVIARESPDIAADLVAKNTVSDSSLQIDTALEVVQSWAARDRAAARKWVEHLAEGALRVRCLEELSR